MSEDKWMLVWIAIIIFLMGSLLEATGTTYACKHNGKFVSGGVTYICYPLSK